MKNFAQSIVRTPGVLFMAILMVGFLINAGVNYLHNTGFEGPNLMAAFSLLVGQFVVAVIYQIRRIGQSNTTAALGQ